MDPVLSLFKQNLHSIFTKFSHSADLSRQILVLNIAAMVYAERLYIWRTDIRVHTIRLSTKVR